MLRHHPAVQRRQRTFTKFDSILNAIPQLPIFLCLTQVQVHLVAVSSELPTNRTEPARSVPLALSFPSPDMQGVESLLTTPVDAVALKRTDQAAFPSGL